MYVTAATFLDALFLLLGDGSDRSRALVKEFLDIHDKQNAKKELMTMDDELVQVYRHLIQVVLSEHITQDTQSSAKLLLLKIKNNEVLKTYPADRDLLTDVLSAAEPITPQQIDKYCRRLRNVLLQADFDGMAKKIFARVKTVGDILDVTEQENELARIEQSMNDTVKIIADRKANSDLKASETYVSLSDKDSILRALNTFIDRNVGGIVKTGLVGLNKATGSRGGMARGETWVFAASSHNYKSGMLVSFMLWAIIYNTFIVQPGKKALVYFVSLENEVNQNLMEVFKTLYCRLEKRQPDLSVLTTEFMTEWLQNYFSQFNIELFIDRYTPHDFSFGKFVKRFNAFEEMGFEIVLFDYDYMSEMRGVDPGDTASINGRIQMIQENYLKFMNHAKQHGYLLTTGHQLTKEAEKMASQDRYAVKKFNASLMADSSDVFRIIDGLIFLQLTVNMDGIKFLTAQLRKNRGCNDTLEKDKFFAYPFGEFGIEDDFGGIPRYVTDIDQFGAGESGALATAVVHEAMF